MIKKIIIACALIIPTVILTTILLTNTEKIGIKKNMVEQRFIVEGMVCTACETKVKESFSNTNIQVINVSYENKEALIKYNANKQASSVAIDPTIIDSSNLNVITVVYVNIK